MRRRLHRGDQGFTGEIALETAEFLGRDHHDFIAPMNGHALRPLAADPPHQFAEARLCILQQPLAGFRITRTVREGIAEVSRLVHENVINDFENGRYRN